MSWSSLFIAWFLFFIASMFSFNIGWRMGEHRAKKRFEEECQNAWDAADITSAGSDEQLRP